MGIKITYFEREPSYRSQEQARAFAKKVDEALRKFPDNASEDFRINYKGCTIIAKPYSELGTIQLDEKLLRLYLSMHRDAKLVSFKDVGDSETIVVAQADYETTSFPKSDHLLLDDIMSGLGMEPQEGLMAHPLEKRVNPL